MPLLTLRGSHPPIPQEAQDGMTSSNVFQDSMFRLVSRHLKRPCAVLDLGAGAGLFSKRLIAAGHQVVSADLSPARATIPCRRVDLNTEFAKDFPERFDAICCFEVIEHVENPRMALRECLKLLNPDGILFLSTPDASGVYSRIKFLVSGELAMFSDAQYFAIGHITPITRWQMGKMLNELELAVLESMDYDGSARIPRTLGDVVKRASLLFLPLMRGHVGRQVMAFACRRE